MYILRKCTLNEPLVSINGSVFESVQQEPGTLQEQKGKMVGANQKAMNNFVMTEEIRPDSGLHI